MTSEPALFVLEVENGAALPEAIRLCPGRELPPMSLGAKGQWHITGPGVRDVHGYVWFDGSSLYLRSMDADAPLRVGDTVLGSDWRRIPPPSRISAGQVTLSFTVAQAAAANPVAVEGARRSRSPAVFLRSFFSRRAPRSSADETAPSSPERGDLLATRIELEGETPVALRHSASLTRPSSLLPGPPPALPDELIATRPSAALPLGPAVELPDELIATRVYRSNLLAPSPDLPDALFATRVDAVPLGLGDPAVHESLAGAIGPSARESLAHAVGPSAPDPGIRAPIDVPPSQSPVIPAKTSRPPHLIVREAWRQTPLVQKTILLLLPLAFVAIRVSLPQRNTVLRKHPAPPVASASSAATTSLVSPVVAPSAPSPPPPAPGGKTRARLAADAVAAGAYSDAIARYDDLALAYPDQAVYRESARILRSKLGTGASTRR